MKAKSNIEKKSSRILLSLTELEYRTQQISAFFEMYAARFNRALHDNIPDVEGTAESFADCFIEASPAGINCGKNDAQFRAMIPKGYDFYKNIGITSMNITSNDIIILDEFHAMSKIHWKSNFVRKDQSMGGIEFDVIYLIQTKDNGIKIFAYITGDEKESFRKNGLI